jgi:rhodanese-related sulfurtransferase
MQNQWLSFHVKISLKIIVDPDKMTAGGVIPCAGAEENDFLQGDINHAVCRICVKDHPIQSVVTDCRSAVGKILLEAALVAVAGIALAFAANQISPRGLALARNYFPTGTNDAVRVATSALPTSRIASINPVTPSPAQQLAEQIKQEGLQLIDGQQTVQLFHDSHLNQGIVFIDARDESYYREGHIPGAYEFDPYHPEQYFPTVLPVCRTAEQIVVYCNGGDCDDSQTAALLLKDVGIANRKLLVYGGGITEWTNNHLPVETGARNSGNPRNANQ